MSSESLLRGKLRKIEALFAGAGTSGERSAAEAALQRVRTRLADLGRSDPPVELKYSVSDEWSHRLFVALCRCYGLEPYRYRRRRYNTLMLRVPRGFSESVLWPEFLQLHEALRAYLNEVTLGVIHAEIHSDTSEAKEVYEALLPRN
jgi:hypothetical protein